MFTATATAVYYTTWTGTTDATAKTITRTNTASGISGLDGSVIQAPLADSTFMMGGERLPWPDDTTTTATPFETMIQVQNLSPVTVTDPASGTTWTVDGVSGGTLVAIPTATNVPGATIGTLSTSHAMWLTGTFRDAGHTGFIEGTNAASTGNPATRVLYLINTRLSDSLIRITDNL
jgi:hypothetical protein